MPAVKESLRWEFEGNIRRIAQRFEGPFVMGDEMTVPDIVLTHCLNWAYAAKFAHGQENLPILRFYASEIGYYRIY